MLGLVGNELVDFVDEDDAVLLGERDGLAAEVHGREPPLELGVGERDARLAHLHRAARELHLARAPAAAAAAAAEPVLQPEHNLAEVVAQRAARRVAARDVDLEPGRQRAAAAAAAAAALLDRHVDDDVAIVELSITQQAPEGLDRLVRRARARDGLEQLGLDGRADLVAQRLGL